MSRPFLGGWSRAVVAATFHHQLTSETAPAAGDRPGQRSVHPAERWLAAIPATLQRFRRAGTRSAPAITDQRRDCLCPDASAVLPKISCCSGSWNLHPGAANTPGSQTTSASSCRQPFAGKMGRCLPLMPAENYADSRQFQFRSGVIGGQQGSHSTPPGSTPSQWACRAPGRCGVVVSTDVPALTSPALRGLSHEAAARLHLELSVRPAVLYYGQTVEQRNLSRRRAGRGTDMVQARQPRA